MQTTHEQDSIESELLHAVAEGNQAAFERIYSLYDKRLYQYIRTLLNDSATTEDIFGETMMAIWRGAGTFVRTSRRPGIATRVVDRDDPGICGGGVTNVSMAEKHLQRARRITLR